MLQPCHEIHPQEEIKPPLLQPSLAKLLQVSLTSEACLILVSSRELIHPHKSSGLDSMSSGRWSNASDASLLSRNASCTIIMYHCILSVCNHTVPNCFSLSDKQEFRVLYRIHLMLCPNKIDLAPSPLFWVNVMTGLNKLCRCDGWQHVSIHSYMCLSEVQI